MTTATLIGATLLTTTLLTATLSTHCDCGSLEDPALTPVGVEEAAAKRSTTQALDPQPELVVVSPMRRATMTALSAYEHLLGKVSDTRTVLACLLMIQY